MDYDITWIMQSYLGEYPGSRSDSDKKFVRAVKSFQAMKDPRAQLVIASDGCKITEELYYKHFKKDPHIDYVFVDKNVPNMYDSGEDFEKYYRGVPRQVARGLAKGILTTYIDSDDFLLPDASTSIKTQWYHQNKGDKKYHWGLIFTWIDNAAALKYTSKEKIEAEDGWHPVEDTFKVKGLKSKWQKWAMNEPGKYAQTAPWNLVHLSSCSSKWIDIKAKKGMESEDTIFNQKIRKEGNGFLIGGSYYVRCHYTDRWDF